MAKMEGIKLIDEKGKRVDGRAVDELRKIKIKAHVLNEAEGSAYIEWGNNKILVGVMGPRECVPHHMSDPFRAVVKCQYLMAPFSSAEEHGRSGPSRRSIEISKVIKEVFENTIILENFPRSMIEIYISILQADGGTRCAATTAAAVALADAGIPMRDMVSAVAIGKVDDDIVLDLNYIEDSKGSSDMAIAMASRNKDVLLMQMEGTLTKEELQKGLGMALKATDTVHDIQVAALKEVYEKKWENPSVCLNFREE